MKYHRVLGVLAVLVLVIPTGTCLEAGEKKPPSPRKVLVKALKNLQKSGSYRTRVRVSGGVTERKDHKVLTPTVARSYEGEVFGRVMKVSHPSVFRTAKQGAIRTGGTWKSLLAAREGVTLDRLFLFPDQILAKAVKHSKTAQWVESKSAKSKKKKKESDADEKDGDKNSGRTVVVKKKGDSVPFPGRIRVEAPAKESLQHVLTVQNSNCFGAG